MKLTAHCPWLSTAMTQDPIGTFRDQSLAIVSEGGSLYTEEREHSTTIRKVKTLKASAQRNRGLWLRRPEILLLTPMSRGTDGDKRPGKVIGPLSQSAFGE